jgi:exodeoxyribonuclease VII small subunit|tara:strand:+ start:529 stop:735 length:207 start_codon:yes stop_codon:yes gene_type:complete
VTSDQSEEFSFEDLYQKLQEIVEQLEQGGLSLSESLELYESGLNFAIQCKKLLTQAEYQIDELIKESS